MHSQSLLRDISIIDILNYLYTFLQNKILYNHHCMKCNKNLSMLRSLMFQNFFNFTSFWHACTSLRKHKIIKGAELAKVRKRQIKNVLSNINFAVYTKRPNIFVRLSRTTIFSKPMTFFYNTTITNKISSDNVYVIL